MNSDLWQEFRQKAARVTKRIALADSTDERVLSAAQEAIRLRIAEPVLISRSAVPPETLDPLRKLLLSIPKFKSLSETEVEERLEDPLVLGCLYLKAGLVDGFIGGATRTTGDTLRAIFSIVGLAPKTSSLFGFFLIENRGAQSVDTSVVLLADCAVIPEPTPKQLAQIAIGSADAFRFFTNQEARVAFLSFSTNGSAEHEKINAVREALQLAKAKAPHLQIEGEWQADAALDVFSSRMKGVGLSPMAGKANVLIVPDLNCGNIAYKFVQRLGQCRAVGPILWGPALPANDLSRGCSAEDVLDAIALTSLQCQSKGTAVRSVECH